MTSPVSFPYPMEPKKLLDVLRWLYDGFGGHMADDARYRIAAQIEGLEANSPETLARRFHEVYEELAPSFGYETRRESSVPWEDVPEPNKALMIAVADVILNELLGAERDI